MLMTISNRIKDMLEDNRSKVELIQLSMISSIASLMYSEYIYNFKHIIHPVNKVHVPEMKQIQDILNHNSKFIKFISINMIDAIINNPSFQEFISLDEFKLFNNDNAEILKGIVDLYIIPNISSTIPKTMSNKFGLNNPSNHLIIESNEIDVFGGGDIPVSYLQYIVDQTVLNLLINTPRLNRIKTNINSCDNFTMVANNKMILTINHINAITPIYLNKQIVCNDSVMKLLSFVTMVDISIDGAVYKVKSDSNNKLIVTEIGIN